MRFLTWLLLLGVLTAALASGCGPQANTGGGSTNPPGDPTQNKPPVPPTPPTPPGK